MNIILLLSFFVVLLMGQIEIKSQNIKPRVIITSDGEIDDKCSMVRCLLYANEWASKNINVNAIAPGYFDTDNTEDLVNDPVRNRQINERIPAGRWSIPDDMKGAVVFLSSSASDYVNGHILLVDGGWVGR